MEVTKIFQYALPEGCPRSFIDHKNLKEGVYDAEYFRISKNSPPCKEDFIPQFFLARCKERVGKFKRDNDHPSLCQMASASLLKTEDDAIRLIKKFKNIGSYIFCGVISKSDGLILVSPSKDFPSHCSFFVYLDVNEKTIFAKGIYP